MIHYLNNSWTISDVERTISNVSETDSAHDWCTIKEHAVVPTNSTSMCDHIILRTLRSSLHSHMIVMCTQQSHVNTTLNAHVNRQTQTRVLVKKLVRRKGNLGAGRLLNNTGTVPHCKVSSGGKRREGQGSCPAEAETQIASCSFLSPEHKMRLSSGTPKICRHYPPSPNPA